jgi:hypothetical protein
MKKQLDDWINTHKYAVVVTTIAIFSLIALRQQSKNTVTFVPYPKTPDDLVGYLKFG